MWILRQSIGHLNQNMDRPFQVLATAEQRAKKPKDKHKATNREVWRNGECYFNIFILSYFQVENLIEKASFVTTARLYRFIIIERTVEFKC